MHRKKDTFGNCNKINLFVHKVNMKKFLQLLIAKIIIKFCSHYYFWNGNFLGGFNGHNYELFGDIQGFSLASTASKYNRKRYDEKRGRGIAE